MTRRRRRATAFATVVGVCVAAMIATTGVSASIDQVVSGQITLLPTAPASVREGALESNTTMFAFDEQQGATLANSVSVDITVPGTYDDSANLTSGTIAAGTVVNSHLIHADRLDGGGHVMYEGTLHVDSNILGIAILRPSLDATDILGVPGTSYPTGVTVRRLNLDEQDDFVIEQTDRRTVTVKSDLLGAFDQVRIITESRDTAAPSISVSHIVDGQNGWNVHSPVAVAVIATDSGSGLAGPPSCSNSFNGGPPVALVITGSEPNFATSVTGEGVHQISCTVSDNAGNSASAGDTVKIDTRLPLVAYTGNAGSYTVDQNVNITCSASDPTPGSGLASTSCANIVGPAYSFGLGVKTYSADGTDFAGNIGHGSTSFTVRVTPGSLCLLTKRFVQGSDKYKALPDAKKVLVDKLWTALCNHLDGCVPSLPNSKKAVLIALYKKAMSALVPLGWLTPSQATTLSQLADGL
jgi:hypothetical protein